LAEVTGGVAQILVKATYLPYMKLCPQCNTKCLNRAAACDCGYIFNDGIVGSAQDQKEKKNAEEVRQIQPAISSESTNSDGSFWRFEDRGPYSLNGFGTTFYGKREFRKNGSFITTEWIVLAYIPLIPIRSLRVSHRGPGEYRWYLGVGSSEKYAVLEKKFPPNWRQVCYTYGYVAFLVIWIYLVCMSFVSMFPHVLDTVSGVTVVFIVCILPVPTPWVLRHFAEKKVYE